MAQKYIRDIKQEEDIRTVKHEATFWNNSFYNSPRIHMRVYYSEHLNSPDICPFEKDTSLYKLYNESLRHMSKITERKILKLLDIWTLTIVLNSKFYKTQRFTNWICFHPHVRGRRHLLCCGHWPETAVSSF
jgi:hypothetical protein